MRACLGVSLAVLGPEGGPCGPRLVIKCAWKRRWVDMTDYSQNFTVGWPRTIHESDKRYNMGVLEPGGDPQNTQILKLVCLDRKKIG